jgi:5S rRNA maturation endonuclease (ribonuclease M5)
VSISSLIPALKGSGRRRAVDEVDRLRENEVIILTNLHAAGDEIALLRNDLLVKEAELAEERRLRAEADQRAAVAEQERNDMHAELLRLQARFGPQIAAEANANRIDVLRAIRPVDCPEDQATAPIDVRPPREAAALGLLGTP